MELISDSDLTEEQLHAISAFKDWYQNGIKHGFGERPTWKLAGPAGSGKSTLAMYALQAVGLDPWGHEVAKVAYTGKAAMVMRSKGLDGSGTIHSAIYLPLDDVSDSIKEMRTRLMKLRGSLGSVPPEDRMRVTAEIEQLSDDIKLLQERSDDDVQWVLNPNGLVANSKLVLCDEASMVGGKVQIDLESYDVPILYLGDSFQLSPILDTKDDKAVSVYFDNDGRTLPVDYQLTEIHRQAEGSPIIRYSRALRENRKDEINFVGKMEGDGVFIRVPRSRLSIEHFAKAGQILCGRNDTRHSINEQVREFLGRTSPYPETGDRLMILKNNKERNVVNGMTGVTLGNYYEFSEKSNTIKVELELEDGRQIIAPILVPYFQDPGNRDAIYDAPGWSRKANLHCDYAFCCTTHKAQGSQYPSGIVLDEPLGKTDELRRRWQYTAVTRFADRVVVSI
jgi:exodeoxyribonuclease-5